MKSTLFTLRKRGLALLLVLTMCLGLLQVPAFAADENQADETQPAQSEPADTSSGEGDAAANGDDAAANGDDAAANGDDAATNGDDAATNGDDAAANGDDAAANGDDAAANGDDAVTNDGDDAVTNDGDDAVTNDGDDAVTNDGDDAVTNDGDAVTNDGDTTGETGETEVSEAVQAFLSAVAKLPPVEEIPEEATQAEVESLRLLVEACQDAYDALTAEDLTREDVGAALVTMSTVIDAFYGIQVLVETSGLEVVWDRDSATLTISGTGVVSDGTPYATTPGGPTAGAIRSLGSSAQHLVVTGPDVSLSYRTFWNFTRLEEITLTDITISDSDSTYLFYMSGVSTGMDVTVTGGRFGTFAFKDSKVKSVTLNGVTISDDASAFENAAVDGGMTVTVDGGNLGVGAFKDCNVVSATLSNLSSTGENTFQRCSNLTTVNVTNVPEIGEYTFDSCDALMNVTLEGVTVLGTQAFNGCTALSEIKGLENVTKLGSSALSGTALSTIDLPNVVEVGNSAFSECTALTSVTLDNVKSIGSSAFFKCTALETIKFDTVEIVSNAAFSGCSGLKTITLGAPSHSLQFDATSLRNCTSLESLTLYNAAVKGFKSLNKSFKDAGKDAPNGLTVTINGGTIGNFGFGSASYLKTVNLSGVGCIEGGAFQGCDKLETVTGITADTQLGYLNSGMLIGDSVINGISDRVVEILRGEFNLGHAPDIEELTCDLTGWDDGHEAKSENWKTHNYGTQLVERARWINPGTGASANTEAEVQVDAYYTAPAQMDYIFVADLSSSMADRGNEKDANARFYDMQSKLLDVTGELLNSGDYFDCRVAIVTFGGLYGDEQTQDSTGFMDNAAVAAEEIYALKPVWESTDYGLGLQEALRLIKGNTGRNTTVVFLSDGAPNKNGSGDMNGTTAAAAIKDEDVKIFGVLHSPDSVQSAQNAMNAVCNEVFTSTDTESFGKAMNDAFIAAYGSYTVTIPVNSAFENVRELEVTAGEAVPSNDGKTITWTITGMPYTTHTLTYRMSLTAENAAKPGEQSYPANADNAKFENEGGASVQTPVLKRMVTGSYTVIHEYYTNGKLTGSVSIPVKNVATGTKVTEDDVEPILLYEGNKYDFTSATGSVTVVGENSGTITLRYDRTVPAATGSYTVVHNYYTNGVLTGSTSTTLTGTVGTVISADGIAKVTSYGGSVYSFTSATGSVTIVADVNSGTITLRYDRTVTYIPPYTPPTGGGGGTTTIPSTPTPTAPGGESGTDIGDNDTPLALTGLNTVDHIAYIIGYQDGTVRPEGHITRAEVATIFFRLMLDEFRTANWSTESGFPDVASSNWYNNAVATCAKAGIVGGYADGEFKGNQNITRAEFAAIAARFLSDEYTGPAGRFSDISGHWAEREIDRAVAEGWINGYPDGTFRPDQDITRAEAVTLINRMLDRMPDPEHLLEDMIRWPDNTEGKWYYEDIQEATNSHDYDRDEIGIMEVWTEKLDERDWKEFEYEWSTAASAPGGEVADNLYRAPGAEPDAESEGESVPETTGGEDE